MQVNEAGLALIRAYEGFRAAAYRCPAGVWTIGFGHTSEAGPPVVRAGMRVSKAEANTILARDVAMFASDIALMIRVPLNANQFSALVSFAYNVGVGAFRSSSVLKAVNASDFAAVPRRLNLWVKANGKTLSGLVKRRASEGQLFMRPPGAVAIFDDVMALATEHERREMDEARGLIEPLGGKALGSSKTVWTSLTGIFSTVSTGTIAFKDEIQKAMWNAQDWFLIVPEQYWNTLIIGFCTAGVGSGLYIIYDRWTKARDDGV